MSACIMPPPFSQRYCYQTCLHSFHEQSWVEERCFFFLEILVQLSQNILLYISKTARYWLVGGCSFAPNEPSGSGTSALVLANELIHTEMNDAQIYITSHFLLTKNLFSHFIQVYIILKKCVLNHFLLFVKVFLQQGARLACFHSSSFRLFWSFFLAFNPNCKFILGHLWDCLCVAFFVNELSTWNFTQSAKHEPTLHFTR